MEDKHFNITEFYIAITNRCNLRCLVCTTGKGKYGAENELEADDWISVIVNLNKSCKIKRLTFGGGEPLLRRDLPQIMKFACGTDIACVNLISNGILMNEEFIGAFTEKELQKIGINFSIDGLEYDHNFIRGENAFQATAGNFDLIYNEYFKPRRINSLQISSILMQENFANYIPFLESFKKYEGVRIDIQPVIPNNELCYLKEKFSLTQLEKDKLQEIVDYVADNPDLSSRPPSLIKYYVHYFDNKLVKSGRCLTGFECLNITFEGYPYLCGKEIRKPLHKFDFKEVFYSQEYQNELERINLCRDPCLQGLHINPENDYIQGEAA